MLSRTLPGTTGFRLTNPYECSVIKNTSEGSILNFPKWKTSSVWHPKSVHFSSSWCRNKFCVRKLWRQEKWEIWQKDDIRWLLNEVETKAKFTFWYDAVNQYITQHTGCFRLIFWYHSTWKPLNFFWRGLNFIQELQLQAKDLENQGKYLYRHLLWCIMGGHPYPALTRALFIASKGNSRYRSVVSNMKISDLVPFLLNLKVHKSFHAFFKLKLHNILLHGFQCLHQSFFDSRSPGTLLWKLIIILCEKTKDLFF